MTSLPALAHTNLTALLTDAPLGVMLCDTEGTIHYVNSAMETLFGYASSDMVGQPVEMLMHTSIRKRHARHLSEFFKHGRGRRMGNGRILSGQHASGQPVEVEIGISIINTATGTYAVAFIANVGPHYLQEKEIRRILASMPFGLLVTDESGTIVMSNAETDRIFGYEQNDLLGKPVETLIPERMRDAHRSFRRAFSRVSQSRMMGSGRELVGLRVNNLEIPIEIALTPLLDDGEMRTLVAISDISQRKALENSLRHRSLFDQLTGLPNRTLFFDRLDQAVKKYDRQRAGFALLMLDLNRFKEVNDSLGHPIGDMLLRDLCQRLTMTMRQSDCIARVGGDEFAAILHEVNSPDLAQALAEKLLDAVRIPFVIATHRLQIGLSIGIALCPNSGAHAEQLIAQADHAMYQAKRGIHPIVYAEQLIDKTNSPAQEIVDEIQQALQQNAFEFFYQPKLDLQSNELLGVEALVRWQQKDGSFRSPNEFMQALEASDLLQDFTFETIRMAAQQIAEFVTRQQPVAVAVNISARMLEHRDLVTFIIDQINCFGFAPELLKLEITETALSFNPVNALRTIEALALAGVSFSIDDFGVGYTSFRYLKKFKIAEIKIDQEFITNIRYPSFDAALVRSIVSFCQDLAIHLVVEGIETQTDMDTVKQLGCSTGQGYFIARPMPISALYDWLSERKSSENR